MPELLGSAVYWMETSRRDPRPTIRGHHDADVVVVGGGYTGLWTAYHLLAADPSLRIVVLEAETIGFGASGRNGGFAMTLLDMSLALLRRNHGDDAARAAHRAVATSVEEIGATIREERIDCEWRHGGLMVVGTNRAQLERVELDLRAAEELGLDGFTRLSRDEARAEVDSPTYLGALREDHCGVLHPAKLAHGLAAVVEEKGAGVFERSPVTDIVESGTGLRVETPSGSVSADQVVLATNAWAAHQPWVGRTVVPLYTYIALTEPLTDDQWASVGWESHCGVEDKRNYVHYYRRTADGRILWGGSDGIVHYSGRITARHDRSARTFARLRSTFHRTFPQLDTLRFTHHWGGPVAVTVDFVPTFTTLLDGRLHTGVGYNGHGVAPSHTGGKILRDKVLGHHSELTELCFVDHPVASFPPEPLQWVGAELSRRALLRQDARNDAGRGGGEMEPLMMKVLRGRSANVDGSSR
ncbi:MAG: FAD-binding oxidoreductase [Acidimicrobiia bacterium]